MIGIHMQSLQMQSLAQVAIERVFNSLPVGLLIACFAWGVLRLLPKQNSRTRFGVWLVALLAVIAIPFCGRVFSSVCGPVFAALAALQIPGVEISALSRHSTTAASAIKLPAQVATFIFLIWLFAACVAMTRIAVGLWRLRKLRQGCTPISASGMASFLPFGQLLDELQAAPSFLSRPVMIATSDDIRVPAALGLWEPMIVLPMWALRELPASDLGVIVRHEFAHLRRWDDWTNLLQKIVRALFFFHPAVWWIENHLSIEREMACDDVVVAQTDNPMGYASCLVSLLEKSLAQRGWAMAQAIVHRAHEASLRLSRILDKNRPPATHLSKPALGLVGAFTLLCVVMLPQTPQFVSFDRGGSSRPSIDSGRRMAYVTGNAVAPAAFPAAFQPAAIPVTLRTAAAPPQKNFGSVSGSSSSSLSSSLRSATARRLTVRTNAPKNDVSAKDAPVKNSNALAQTNFPSALDALLEASAPGVNRDEGNGDEGNVVEANAVEASVEDQSVRPAMTTLVYFQSTKFGTAGFGTTEIVARQYAVSGKDAGVVVWRVEMWRVTMVGPLRQWRAQAPVANKT